MKHKLLITTITLGVVAIAGRAVFAPSARAQSVDAAERNLARTEADLKNATATTAAQARTLETHLTTEPGSIPADIGAFRKTTERLATLRDRLRVGIDDLASATTHSLAELDRERSLITDPVTRAAMRNLRTQARHETDERLAQARAALAQLDRVLTQGADVVHAANCVAIADDLTTKGTGLDEHTKRATEEAKNYTSMTNDLLGRLTTAYTE